MNDHELIIQCAEKANTELMKKMADALKDIQKTLDKHGLNDWRSTLVIRNQNDKKSAVVWTTEKSNIHIIEDK